MGDVKQQQAQPPAAAQAEDPRLAAMMEGLPDLVSRAGVAKAARLVGSKAAVMPLALAYAIPYRVTPMGYVFERSAAARLALILRDGADQLARDHPHLSAVGPDGRGRPPKARAGGAASTPAS